MHLVGWIFRRGVVDDDDLDPIERIGLLPQGIEALAQVRRAERRQDDNRHPRHSDGGEGGWCCGWCSDCVATVTGPETVRVGETSSSMPNSRISAPPTRSYNPPVSCRRNGSPNSSNSAASERRRRC